MRPGVLGCCFLATLHVAAAETISPQNVSRLAVAWTYDTGDQWRAEPDGGDGPAFEATPAHVDGVLYLSTPLGTVIALDADTGREVWKIDLDVARGVDYSDFANRGPTTHGERLYVGTVDARLVCLERRNGRLCADFGRNGTVDLLKGLRHPPEEKGEYGVTSPPAAYRDVVIVGSSVADNSRTRMASGEVRAFDVKTGALRWTFHPLPAELAAGGANAWSRIVVDDELGFAFMPTGSPSPDYFGGLRPGPNADSNSMVVLNALTGERVWSFQTVHHDLWDYDVAAPALLYPGRDGPAVAVGSKSGHVFLFDRKTGRALFPIEERAVPQSDLPGESAAPTQPFPTKPVSLAPQRVSEGDLWGATPEDLDHCRRLFASLRNDGVFTPPSLRGSLNAPGNIGGLHWGGLAWDATNRLLIAPINRLPAIIRLIPRAQFSQTKKQFPTRETTEQDGAPYSMSREFFRAPSGRPCVAPPWGELIAIHADTGDIAWRTTLGDLRDAGFGAGGAPTGSPNLGGLAITDTGVAFIGATADRMFRAFDTRTGREIWKAKLPTGARATPLIYTTKRGEQRVAIAAGGHDNALSPEDSKLVVFALAKPQ